MRPSHHCGRGPSAVIASEAKQSRPKHTNLDCLVGFRRLAMTTIRVVRRSKGRTRTGPKERPCCNTSPKSTSHHPFVAPRRLMRRPNLDCFFTLIAVTAEVRRGLRYHGVGTEKDAWPAPCRQARDGGFHAAVRSPT